jgi:hypothetical protein
MRRSRVYVLALLGLIYVFVLGDDDTLSGVVLVVAGLWFWLPVLNGTMRGFRTGWQDDAHG